MYANVTSNTIGRLFAPFYHCIAQSFCMQCCWRNPTTAEKKNWNFPHTFDRLTVQRKKLFFCFLFQGLFSYLVSVTNFWLHNHYFRQNIEKLLMTLTTLLLYWTLLLGFHLFVLKMKPHHPSIQPHYSCVCARHC